MPVTQLEAPIAYCGARCNVVGIGLCMADDAPKR